MQKSFKVFVGKKIIYTFLLPIFLLGCSSNPLNQKLPSFADYFKNNNKEISSASRNNITNRELNYLTFSLNNYKSNVLKAVKNNPAFQAALLNLEAQELGEKIAESASKPQVNFQASTGATRVDAENSIAALGSVSVSKVMYDSGSISSNVISQQFRTLALKEQLDNQAEGIALSGYLTLLELSKNQKIESIYDAGLKKGEPLIEQIDNISTSGIADKTMILKAKKEYSELLIGSIRAKAATKNEEVNFRNIFQGENIPKLDLMKPLKVENLNILIKKMKNYHPSIKSQNLIIESLEEALKSTIAKKNPNITLRAGVNAPADNPIDDGSANLGFLVNYIYNDGGRIESQIKNIEAQIKSSIKQKEDILRNLETQLNLSYENYNGLLNAKKELTELVKILKETSDTSKAQLVSGRAKIQDVLNNELDLARKEIELISVDTQLISASYTIRSITSGLIPKIIK